MPKVSIIMPAYNKENYIQKTLDSIIQQKFIDFELIIIDDGSTDKTRNILEEYRVLDKRIKIHHIENGGVSVSYTHLHDIDELLVVADLAVCRRRNIDDTYTKTERTCGRENGRTME